MKAANLIVSSLSGIPPQPGSQAGSLPNTAIHGVLRLLLVLVPALVLPPSASSKETGSLGTEHWGHTATLLADGKVLVVSGGSAQGVTTTVEIYDPATGTWSATNPLVSARHSHTATRLANNKVLVAGGYPLTFFGSGEVYDPAAGMWSPTGTPVARLDHTATLLPDGKVLAAGGTATPSADLYDPVTNSWSAAPAPEEIRKYHTATALSDGTVLVAGGYNDFGGGALASAELYDPAANSWSTTGSLSEPRQLATATLLSDGRVLLVGGSGNRFPGAYLASAEIYDPSAGAWNGAGTLTDARRDHTATLLADGRVLVAGGYDGGPPESYRDSVEIYDPSSNTWSFAAPLESPRVGHTATLLANGKVLVAGGSDSAGPLASAELLDPSGGNEPGQPILTIKQGSLASSTELVIEVTNIPAGQTFHIREAVDGRTFAPLEVPFDFNASTQFPTPIAIDALGKPSAQYQVWTGPSVP